MSSKPITRKELNDVTNGHYNKILAKSEKLKYLHEETRQRQEKIMEAGLKRLDKRLQSVKLKAFYTKK